MANKKNGSKNANNDTLKVSRIRTSSPAKRTSKTASSGGRRKSTSSPKRTAKPEREKLPPERIDEIAGIIFIAVGLVTGILTYVKTEAVLKSIVSFMFGLTGVVQYALPIVLVAVGVALIAVPRRQTGTGAVAVCLGMIWCIDCIIHLAVKKIGSAGFGEYLKAAYRLGVDSRKGGGFLSAAPSYGLAKLITPAGAMIVFAAAALVLLLLVTRISIRSAGRKVIAKVDAIEDRRKARLINETVGDSAGQEKKPAKKEPDQDELKIGVDTEPRGASGIRRRKPHETEAPASDGSGELEIMPTKGSIPLKKKKEAHEPVFTPLKQDPVEEIPDYDPFETIEITPEDNITGEVAGVDVPAEEPAAAKPEEKPADDDPSGTGDIKPNVVQVYQRPPISLLKLPDKSESIANDSPEEKGRLLIETLASFNINARVTHISVGPVITRFEIQPAQGVRVNRITSLSNDIALALAAPRVRIEAPIPGKAAVGIEIPNKDTAMVRLREVLDTREFSVASSPLTFALGKDIAGKPVYANLEKMPHMLIAGATGSGKSVCINSIILSTVYKSSPDEVRMILIDPKVVELSIFAPVPHLYCPVVTDAKKAAGVLKWACSEMDQRYNKMSKVNARDLARYNALMEDPADRMPRLMIIIDELADLMIVSAKDVEESIARLAQLGRACGIHLIVATQRPSVDVITGLIKTNIPSRIAFAVASAIDSRVILDMGGAEKLLGHGDMLFHPNGAAKPIRAQGAYVSDEEVESIMDFFHEHQLDVPKNSSVLDSIPDLTAPTGQGNGKQEDELLPDAVRIVMESGSASISMIQRRLRVGYARAARLVDIMEQMKLVSGFDGSKPRKVLIDEAGYQELFGSGGSEY